MKKKECNIIDTKIVNYVDSFFEELHYSKEIETTKEKIIIKLNEEYFKEKDKDKRNAFKIIVNKYSNIEDMLEAVKGDKKKLDKWYND